MKLYDKHFFHTIRFYDNHFFHRLLIWNCMISIFLEWTSARERDFDGTMNSYSLVSFNMIRRLKSTFRSWMKLIVGSCNKLEQTEVSKKSNRPNFNHFCMQIWVFLVTLRHEFSLFPGEFWKWDFSIIISKKFGQTKIIEKSKCLFSDNFCMQKLIFQTKNMSQCRLNFQICMQKLLKIGRLLFLIICLSELFATFYITVIWKFKTLPIKLF